MLYKGESAWSEVPESRFNAKAFHHPDSNRNGTFHTHGGHFLKQDVSVFDAPFFGITPSEARAMDPQLRLLLEVAFESVENAGWTLEKLRGSNTSVYTALYNRDYQAMLLRDPEHLPFYTVTGNGEALFSNRISYFFDLRGPSFTLDTGCSGGLVALQNACQSIWTGQAEQAMVGGSNLVLDPSVMVGPSFMQFYSSEGRSYAFDQKAAGYGRGEGVACLVLKRLSDAVRDGDPVQAVIRAAAVNQDGRTNGITAPSGDAQESLIRKTYAMAGLDLHRTSYVETHGSGTSLGDRTETTVLDAVLVTVLVRRNDPCSLESRQISVNSFGYGGTNAHVVLDAPDQPAIPTEPTSESDHLIVLSARSQASGQEMTARLRHYLETISDVDTPDLGSLPYTLCERRTPFAWRASLVVDSVSELETKLKSLSFVHAPPSSPKVAFIFSGQGSHWYEMGRELLEKHPVFRSSIHQAETCLTKLGAEWLLIEELTRTPDACRLDNAFIAQPACTAIQLALVYLLASWGITPTAVTGHSSGEIAAAYACRAITFESAICVAYSRGKSAHLLISNSLAKGGMLAAGLSREDAAAYIAQLAGNEGSVHVACVNSPKSVTISGDVDVIAQLQTQLEDAKVFVRRLPVEVAYHSHHILRIASEYRDLLAGLPLPTDCGDGIPFISSVEGGPIPHAALTADYWVKNLTAPVLFADAMSSLLKHLGSGQGGSNSVVALAELGPHSSLKGPIQQVLTEFAPCFQTTKFVYASPLIRNKAATTTSLSFAGELFRNGIALDLRAVNFPGPGPRPACLTSLPSYPWDHSTSYWHESQVSRSYRHREHPPHPLLGVLTPDSSVFDLRWRKYIRLSEMPWLAGHKVEGRIVYRGAGYLCMALDAAIQYAESTNAQWAAVDLSDVEFLNPLIVSPDAEAIEMSFSLRPSSTARGRDLAGRHEFVITSRPGDKVVFEHCRGFVAILSPDRAASFSLNCTVPVNVHGKTALQSMDPLTMYDRLLEIGNQYCDPFCAVSSVSFKSGYCHATVDIAKTNTQDHSLFSWVHPATLDACLHALFPAAAGPIQGSNSVMPTSVKRVTFSAACARPAAHAGELDVFCHTRKTGGLALTASFDVQLGGEPLLSLASVAVKELERKSSETSSISRSGQCQQLVTYLDTVLSQPEEVKRLCLERLTEAPRPRHIALLTKACRYFAVRALSKDLQLGAQDMPRHRKEYFEWLERLSSVVGVEDVSPADAEQFLQGVQITGYEGQMVCQIGRNLDAILYGLAEPLSFMTENNLLHNVYRHDEGMQRCAIPAAEHIRLQALKNPRLRILEIGAGTGGTTLPVLQALTRDHARPLMDSYTFTDISSGFFVKAEETFQAWKPLVQFKTLDIERNPGEQGFEAATYDAIVAANVLHATTYIEQTMHHVRSLLKPEWDSTLRETGFSGTDLCIDPHETSEEQTDNLLISTALPDYSDDGEVQIQLVLSDQQLCSTESPAYQLAWALSQAHAKVADDIVSLGEAKTENKNCLCLAGLDDAFLSTMDQPAFEAFKRTFNSAKEIVWVTRGAMSDYASPRSSLALGLIRALRKEIPAVRMFIVDLDPDQSVSQQTLCESLDHFIRRLVLIRAGDDNEFLQRNGMWHVPRLITAPEPSRAIQATLSPNVPTRQTKPLIKADQPCRLSRNESGSLQNLSFTKVPFEDPIAQDEVEIEVHATGINFRDSMILLGEMDDDLIGECSGIVRKVGEFFKGRLSIGDRVYTWFVPAHSTIVRAKGCLVHRIPSAMSFEQAASLPIIYGTVYYSLSTAAILFAQHIGATVFTTVGSDDKRALLMEKYGISQEHIFSTRTGDFRHKVKTLTNGTGVDVVLNSLSGSFLQDSLDSLAPFGRFLEIGKRDILSGARMDMAALAQNITIAAVDLLQLARHRLPKMAEVYSRVHELVVSGTFAPPTPLHVFPVSRIEEAFRHFQARPSGKTILSFTPNDQIQVLDSRAEGVSFKPDATYLLAGGQGGLGRAICSWMAQYGARNIAILSPSGDQKQTTQDLIRDLAIQGAKLVALPVDISNGSQLFAAMETIKATLPPLTYTEHQSILSPKVAGTQHLHNATVQEHLDFFTILSSYAGLIGNAGQASYAGASTFQDAFARWRTGQGYPTRSLNLGPIVGAGYLHDHPEELEWLQRAGLEVVELDAFLALLGYAISSPVRTIEESQIGIGWAASSGLHSSSALFSHLAHKETAGDPDQPNETTSDQAAAQQASPEVILSDALAKGLTPALTAGVTLAVSRSVSALTGVALEDIDCTKSISFHGGDSLVVVQFRNWLRKTIDPGFGAGRDVAKLSLQEIAEMAAEYAKK
ncbi:hypothetical protein ASPCAL03194 [Aspergillus calidoustus]|uniref:Carrier domain-containing protein n=1 Tax=Aspergillus calidoustus TaxID=454130 RepID=A0A0U5GMI0_ASPCI|nr:hypothetical protein ASPCAL03194 [Aspergillus calidoustus]